jgi:proteasome activator subunit 4
MDLIEKVAKGQLGHYRFTEDQIKFAFGVGLRSLSLPIAAGKSPTFSLMNRNLLKFPLSSFKKLLSRKPDKGVIFAGFIVNTIYPASLDPENRGSLNMLIDLIQSIESFFHPSNFGRWTHSLLKFIENLSYSVLNRWLNEQRGLVDYGEEYFLSKDEISAFVQTIVNVSYLSMFGKDPRLIGYVHTTFKYLAWLDPNAVFPGLLERIYPSLQTLTETLRTSSSLSTLCMIVGPLVSRENYPQGGKHVLPLLNLTLPGIDINDPQKSIISLYFASYLFLSIPLIDSTKSDEETDWGAISGDLSIPRDLEQENLLCKANTSGYEEWIAQYLNRSFSLFENMPEKENSPSDLSDSGLVLLFIASLDVICNQMSSELYEFTLETILRRAKEVNSNAIDQIGELCGTISRANPSLALSKFIPLCIKHIYLELEHGAGTSSTTYFMTNPPSDFTMNWYQNILSQILPGNGTEILKYIDQILALADKVLNQCKAYKAGNLGSRLIRNILNCLATIYLKRVKSHNQKTWNSEDFQNNHHLIWGKFPNPEDIQLEWHTPSQPEIEKSVEIFHKYIDICNNDLEAILDNDWEGERTHFFGPVIQSEWSNRFRRCVGLMDQVLTGSATFILTEADFDENSESDYFKLNTGVIFTDPKHPEYIKIKNKRLQSLKLLHRAFKYLVEHRKDDVHAFHFLIQVIENCLTFRGSTHEMKDANSNTYKWAKYSYTFSDSRKLLPRSIFGQKVLIHQIQRILYYSTNTPKCQEHRDLLHALVELSMYPYPKIRKLAQNSVKRSLKIIPKFKKDIYPRALDAIEAFKDEKDPIQLGQVTGALYLLKDCINNSKVINKWEFLPRLIITLLKAQKINDTSCQELIQKILLSLVYDGHPPYVTKGTGIPVKDYINESAEYGLVNLDKSLIEKAQANSKSKFELKQKGLETIISELIKILNEQSTTWRFTNMAGAFLQRFTTINSPISPQAVKSAFQQVIVEVHATRKMFYPICFDLLSKLKKRSLAITNSQIRGHYKKVQVTEPILNPDFNQKYLDSISKPINSKSIEDVPLIDNSKLGWFAWPKECPGYQTLSEGEKLAWPSVVPKEIQDCYDAIWETISSPEYIEKWITYLTQEVGKEKDSTFNTVHCKLFKAIFQIYGPKLLELFKPHIEKLVNTPTEAGCQKGLSELLAGLLRGSKHWSLSETSQLWEYVMPLLTQCLKKASVDTSGYWDKVLSYSTLNRDPRRIQPLIKLIFQELNPFIDIQGQIIEIATQLTGNHISSFDQYKYLNYVRIVNFGLSWKSYPWSRSLLDSCVLNLHHQFKSVRGCIALLMYELLQNRWHSGISVQQFLDNPSMIEDDSFGIVDSQHIDSVLDQVYTKIELYRSQHDPAQIEPSDYTNCCKTLINLILAATLGNQFRVLRPHFPKLCEKMFDMLDGHQDIELRAMISDVLRDVYRRHFYPNNTLQEFIVSLNNILKEGNWIKKVRVLYVYQPLVFNHLFNYFNRSEEFDNLVKGMLSSLLDDRIEVS